VSVVVVVVASVFAWVLGLCIFLQLLGSLEVQQRRIKRLSKGLKKKRTQVYYKQIESVIFTTKRRLNSHARLKRRGESLNGEQDEERDAGWLFRQKESMKRSHQAR